jgi:hypothetical protein
VRGRFAAGVVSALVASLAAPSLAQIALGPGAIVARVRDASGLPLAGALVSVAGPTSREASTNAAGLVSLVALPAGRYVVAISAAGYAPWQTVVVVGSVTSAPAVVAPNLQPTSLANLGAPSAVTTLALPGLGADLDPFVAHALLANPSLDVVPSAGGASVSVDGTLPYESRVELDGIPLAGGSTSPAAVRFRDLLGLSDIDVVAGPSLGNAPVRDAIGGIVNYRTPATDGAQAAGIDAGYDSAFGSFQHTRAVRDFGRFGVAFDAVAGGGSDRSQSLKASYAFAPGTSADFAIYALQATGDVGPATATRANAPAYSAGVRAPVGDGTFEARAYGSSLAVTDPLASFVPNENARVRGVALAYDLPLGQDRIGFAFDRRTEIASLGSAPPVSQTFTSLGARGSFALTPIARLAFGDTYSGGTLVPARDDPEAAFALQASRAFGVRLSAGSSFATAPDDVLAGRTSASGGLAPETAFGYRITLDERLDASDRAWLAAYSERRFETFAALADAANRGVGIGFERAPARGLGASAYVALQRTNLAGGATPLGRRSAAFSAGAGAELADEPDAKERLALTYRFTPACEERVGATFLGANNGLSPAASTLAEISLCIPLFGLADARVGESNLFGAAVSDPSLAPLYRPHEFTFSLGSK